MTDYLKVSTTSMASDINELEDLLKAVPNLIEDLQTNMTTLGTCWEGEAWQAFQGQVSDDIDNMYELYRFLSTFLEIFGNAADTYQQTEQAVYDSVQGIK